MRIFFHVLFSVLIVWGKYIMTCEYTVHMMCRYFKYHTFSQWSVNHTNGLQFFFSFSSKMFINLHNNFKWLWVVSFCKTLKGLIFESYTDYKMDELNEPNFKVHILCKNRSSQSFDSPPRYWFTTSLILHIYIFNRRNQTATMKTHYKM